jgi:peptidoglycan/LPS O-acetylase OafA/YrhL
MQRVVAGVSPPAATGARQSLAADRYVPSLDGLRAVSILLVVVSHLGLKNVVPGAFGVTLFFFISGLLITDQLISQMRRTGTIGLGNFYARRALRLMPAGVAFIVLAGLVFTAAGGQISAAGWLSALLYGGNYYELFAKYDTTIPGVRHPFNIIWSLAVEEHYYLLWPAVLLFFGTGRRLLTAIGCLCVGALLWRAYLYHHCFGGHPGWICGADVEDRIYKATDTRLDSIAWGAGLALLADSDARWLAWLGRPGRVHAFMLAVLASTFVLRGEAFRQVARYSLQGVALAVLVPAIVLFDSPLRRALETRVAVFIGRLSYSMYLWHWGALAAADYLIGGEGVVWAVVAAILTAGFSVASYFGIERPMLRVRRRFGSHATQ